MAITTKAHPVSGNVLFYDNHHHVFYGGHHPPGGWQGLDNLPETPFNGIYGVPKTSLYTASTDPFGIVSTLTNTTTTTVMDIPAEPDTDEEPEEYEEYESFEDEEDGAGYHPGVSLHVDPFEAAKELRMMAKHAAPSGSSFTATIGTKDYYLKKIVIKCDGMAGANSDMRQLLDQMHEAAQQRKITRYRVLQYEVFSRLADQEYRVNQTRKFTDGALKSEKAASTAGLDIERLKVLVQALPTEPNLPTSVPENVLRAIATLLKNSGVEVTSHE